MIPPVVPGRPITGLAAVLLPFRDTGTIDWKSFEAHVERTAAAGLVPAVNMDTGFGALLSKRDRTHALDVATAHGEFVAGAYVDDTPDDAFDADAYCREMEAIAQSGGLPIVFPSWGLKRLPDPDVGAAFAVLGQRVDRFLAFELGEMFAPQGRIFTNGTFHALLDIPQCVGAKHSSLSRPLEWERLALRDRMRPEFMVLTGNDRAIDMVIYGSDYLLGLATFAPDWFAARDRAWADRDPRFWDHNDLLQYLGQLAFRDPVPAYRHSAAQFLKLRGWIRSDETHPESPARKKSDVKMLEELLARAEAVFG